MNDFTKEELILLEFALTQEIMNTCPQKHDTNPLRVKLESMIDNYCEHENIVTGAYPRSNPPKKCEACGVLHYDNQ